MRQYLLLLFIFAFIGSPGQGLNNTKINVSGTVKIKNSEETLPYVNIVCKNTRKGSISNTDGQFRMENLHIGDTLLFSFIGYKSVQMVIVSNPRILVEMEPETELLNEVFILAESDVLYQMLSKSRKKRNSSTKTAKTYFSLASFSAGKRVEMLEAYYNGSYNNYHLNNLNFKNGRIALKDDNGRFFLSTETSKALCMHRSTKSNEYFPISPTELGLRKLRKNYSLDLESRFVNDQKHVIYVLNAAPKLDNGEFFASKVWLDSNISQILRQELKIENASQHPFSPIAHMGSLQNVGLKISKSFQLLDNIAYIQSVDFSYELVYKSTNGRLYDTRSQALLYAFDYESEFNLPQFEFSSGTYEDYRKINASPYNEYFWNHSQEFALKDDQAKNAEFLAKGATIDNRNLFTGNDYFKNGFLEHPYVFWSPKRVIFKVDTEQYKKKQAVLPSDRYHLEVQIYFDYNILNDSVHFHATTVFDPFKTYSYLPDNNITKAFINIYFDLVEIERRKMMKKLKESTKKPEDMMRIYEETKWICSEISKRYLKEVRRGTNLEALNQWNDIVIEELNIDNLNLFVQEIQQADK